LGEHGGLDLLGELNAFGSERPLREERVPLPAPYGRLSWEIWQSTIRHIALEGRCYVLNCNQFVTKEMYPAEIGYRDGSSLLPDVMCPGGSAIVDPLGEYVAGPIFSREEANINRLSEFCIFYQCIMGY
jgi:predicted amidohydrolase